jgi:hypothetical protein
MALPGVGGALRGAVIGMRATRAAARGARFTKIPYGKATNLSRKAVAYRRQTGMLKGGNVAVARYRTQMGFTRTMAVQNIPMGQKGMKHTERVLMDALDAKGIKPNKVEEIYSELEPCLVPIYCKNELARTFPRSELSYSFEYGATEASRKAGVNALADTLTGLFGG